MIQVYAPTEDSKNEREESKIYYRLHLAEARNERSTERCESGKRAEIGSNHYLLLIVIKLRMKGENIIGGGSIRVKKLKNKAVRWEFEARLRRRYSNRVDKKRGDDNLEAAWAELKEEILR